MTDQLFAEDAYLTSCEATVVDIRDEGVILDRTVFYARGGGQPGDTGTLRWDNGMARVTDTVKMGGDIVHQVEGDAPARRSFGDRGDRLDAPAPADAHAHGAARALRGDLP